MSSDETENEEEIDQVALETKEQQHPTIVLPHTAPGLLISSLKKKEFP